MHTKFHLIAVISARLGKDPIQIINFSNGAVYARWNGCKAWFSPDGNVMRIAQD